MNRDLASRLVVGLEGTWPTAAETAWLSEKQPHGVILFSRNIFNFSSLRNLCDVLHQLVPGLEIMADHEGGPVSQLSSALGRPPSAWSLGVLDDVGLTARVFEQTGHRLGEAGIDRVLAPVADVLTEGRNPVIGVRSFGADPALVTRHTVAAVTGLLTAGVKVCLKHWPGHGGSSEDSHLTETPLHQGGLPAPFEGGLTAGADAVMVGHLLVGDRQDEAPGCPVTLDPDFLAASRKRLDSGRVENLLFFADDITMGALGPAMERQGVPVPAPQETGLFDPGSLPPAWFRSLADAGCDRLLIRGIPWQAFPLTAKAVPPPAKPAPATAPDFVAGSYVEARRRLWSVVGGDFADPDADLLWLDFSRHDRWGAAAGQDDKAAGNSVLDQLLERVSGMFRSVSREPAPLGSGQPWRRLLVSSHRPLPDLEALAADMAPQGVCLVLGHPSLEADLKAFLGHKWKVGALFDVFGEDLGGDFGGPEQ